VPDLPNEAEGAHTDGLELGVAIPRVKSGTGWWEATNRLVISKVVPKIWARTNSAIIAEN
jgi:hypothetical protein